MEAIVPELLAMGPPGIAAIVAGWLYWQERKRANELVDRLIQQAERHIDDGVKRETAILTSLETITAFVKGRAG